MSLFGDDRITSDGGAFCGYSAEEKAEMRSRGEYPLDNYKPSGPSPTCLAIVLLGIVFLIVVLVTMILLIASK